MDFIIHKVNQFSKHKLNLINLINKIPQTTCNSDNEKISHTDYKIPQTMKREYVDYFVNNIYGDYCNNLRLTNKVNLIGFRNIWFQVYNKGDWHGSHTHPGTHFTNILYVNLPDKNLKTFLKKPNGEVVNFNAEEGDLITFPAYYEHSSPENNSSEQKIIISFNIDIQSYKY